MPAYNAENYIGYAIESVLSQTYSNFELIIVNDGSTDKTESIVQQYSAQDQRIILVSQENSGSAGAARNTALKYVTGDYIQMLDADDYFELNMLEVYNNKLKETQYDILLPDCISVDKFGNFLSSILPIGGDYTRVLCGREAFILSLDWTIHGIMCIKSAILKELGYDICWMNSDELTTRKLFLSATRISFADTKYFYRQHSESTTKSKRNNVKFYQTLWTDHELYKIICKKTTDYRLQRVVAKRYMGGFCALQKKYYDEEASYSEKEKLEIQNVMKNTYKTFNIKFCIKNLSKISIFILASLGSYHLFCWLRNSVRRITEKMA